VRLSGMVTAFAVCVVLLVAGPAPSQASAAVSSSDAVSSAAGSRVLPRRAMNDEVFRNAKGWLIFKGNVDPGWNHKNVQIYKRLCQKGCEWTLVKKVGTDGSGRWRTRIYAPRTGYWYWKGLVPRAGGYGRSVTQTWRTFVE
jgi:hypothetical protein